jgi:hypothetical protein
VAWFPPTYVCDADHAPTPEHEPVPTVEVVVVVGFVEVGGVVVGFVVVFVVVVVVLVEDDELDGALGLPRSAFLTVRSMRPFAVEVSVYVHIDTVSILTIRLRRIPEHLQKISISPS